MSEQVYLTQEGAEKLRLELDDLINNQRLVLARQLKDAKDMGDLSENADYIDAKERQGFLEGRIRYIENLLHTAIVVSEADVPAGSVHVGSTVTIQAKGEPPETYMIVGAAEADPTNGKISHESPLGAALLGARAGQKIVFNAPVGQLNFKVLEIH
jgi:transcription elongation factor GreA